MAAHYRITQLLSLSHSFFLTVVVSGSPPLILYNKRGRCPLVLQAAERLLVHTFSLTELRRGERATDIYTVSL